MIFSEVKKPDAEIQLLCEIPPETGVMMTKSGKYFTWRAPGGSQKLYWQLCIESKKRGHVKCS